MSGYGVCLPKIRPITFIQFPKPLIAAVNGPAVGVSVTLLGLCDLVYAAEHVRDSYPLYSVGLSIM